MCKEILMQLPNTTVSDTIHMLLSGINIFYSVWFITILAPISWRKKKIIRNMFVLWCAIAVIRVILLFDPSQDVKFKKEKVKKEALWS